jgi:hypothetical protein
VSTMREKHNDAGHGEVGEVFFSAPAPGPPPLLPTFISAVFKNCNGAHLKCQVFPSSAFFSSLNPSSFKFHRVYLVPFLSIALASLFLTVAQKHHTTQLSVV